MHLLVFLDVYVHLFIILFSLLCTILNSICLLVFVPSVWILMTPLEIWTLLRRLVVEKGRYYDSVYVMRLYSVEFLRCEFNRRVRSGSCQASGSKACREKMRRDRLNDRHVLKLVFLFVKSV